MRRLILFLSVVSSAGCGYRTCGTMKYWTTGVDERLDDDSDGYIDLIEACKDDYGSWGYNYDNGYTQLLLSDSSWDMEEAADVAYDYTPVTEIVFLSSHLESGEVLTMDHLAGYGAHRPDGMSGAAMLSASLTDARIEILKGPKEDNFDGQNYRMSWELTFGDVTADMSMGFQHFEGEDWINFTPETDWDPPEHNGIQPPDEPL